MKRTLIRTLFLLVFISTAKAQEIIPLDTSTWNINARSYVLEQYKGQRAIYLQQGSATLKDFQFLNGTIEFDLYLTNRRAFPGVTFRVQENGDGEHFYIRPHLSGQPDANQVLSVVKGIGAWQLYFGESYSFPYEYNYEGWTHVKIVVNGNRAQVFLDHAEKPHLSWVMKHEPRAGAFRFGHGLAPMHYANFKIDPNATELIDFNPIPQNPVEGAITEWSVSDKFQEKSLDHLDSLSHIIKARTWLKNLQVDETSAVDISWANSRYASPGNTAFVKLTITSEVDQIKLFEFGYSDRVVVILNEKFLYKGTNGYRTRDYRYLGTVGLFDATYLNLKKGENTLLMAVSEDFGGWIAMGRIQDMEGITIKP